MATSPSRSRIRNSWRLSRLSSRRRWRKVEATPQIDATPNSPDAPARVLIVDDESHNRELLAVLLRQEGLLLLSVASGEEALALVAAQPPDLILLDVMMPGMDGYQVAAKIKAGAAT